MNNWYIDRSKNFIHDGLRDILSIINESELAGEEMTTAALSRKFEQNGVLGNAVGNPNAAFTRFRDHGLIRMNNTVGESAKMYLNNRFTFGELVIDLFIKRFANKDEYPSVRPVIILCKLFSCMMDMGVDIDDIFVTYFECHEYLLPINSYEEVTYELVEKIISERQYADDGSGYSLQHRVDLDRNEEINYSIWFNALKQTPLFVSLEDNDNGYTLRPNQNQKEFFKYISENANEFDNGNIRNNSTLYEYYCNREYGLSEIIAPVIKPDVTIQEDDVKVLFDYLFGYDQKVDFDYSTYVKHECFGTYFAFISIPNIAIAKIEEDNPEIANLLYKYVRNMGTYYLDNIDIAYGNLKSGEKVVTEITAATKSNEENFIKWLHTQRKSSGEPYKENTVSQYTSALKAVSLKFNLIPIFSIDSVDVFDEIDQQIRNNPDFDRFNKARGNGALSAGLIAYRKFLTKPEIFAAQITLPVENDVTSAWFVGYRFDDRDHDEFLEEGIWYHNGDPVDLVNEIKVGDRIAIKSTGHRSSNIPFENYGQTVSFLRIKAIGVVTENKYDGKTLLVDWEKLNPVREWYVFTGAFRDTINKVTDKDVLDFVFNGTEQDYNKFLQVEPWKSRYQPQPITETPDEYIDDDGAVEELQDFEYKEITMVPKQVIYYGAPGTGKSFEVDKQLIEKYPDEEVRDFHTARVVFHPDYTYSDFVGSIRPVKPEGKPLTYEFVEGPFSELLKKCFLHSEEEFYLVLEEINRGNAAAIFGDLFQLLDRDDKQGKSSYRINNKDIAGFLKKDKRLASLFVNDKVWLPSNFNIVCTMNTADQNVFVLDSAFKRRFSEEYTEIDFSKLTNELKEATAVFNGTTDLQQLFANTNLKNFVDKLAESGELNRDWPTFAKVVNYIIDDINEESGSEQISEDKKLGPFFVSVKDLENRKNFINKVLHYLKQDVFKYVDFYFTESYQTIHSKYINETADIFNLLKRQGE